MKRRNKRRYLRNELQDSFIRGFVSAGLLATVEGHVSRQRDTRRVLFRALQGGTALAAGSVAARAIKEHAFATSLAAIAAGAAGLLTIEYQLKKKPSKEKDHEQEKA